MFVLAADDPINHVKDVYLWKIGDTPIITMHMVTLIVAAILLVLVMRLAAKAIETGPESQGNDRYLTKGRLAQLIETMIVYLRDEMLKPVMGERSANRYMPYLLTLFFFILINNLLGLIPVLDITHLFGGHTTWFGGTATGNLNITAGLATIAFFIIIIHAIKDLGWKGFLEHMTGGLHKEHWSLYPVVALVFIVEVAGLFIKPAALAIRLFANMVAGHTLMAVLMGFGAMAINGGMKWWGWGTISVVSAVAAVLITFLELFVAFLQAFIFMFLTAVFISLFTHHDEHEHEHEHAHETDHGKATVPEPVAV
jgi:F-type H+-transporting ATPase subunit a